MKKLFTFILLLMFYVLPIKAYKQIHLISSFWDVSVDVNVGDTIKFAHIGDAAETMTVKSTSVPTGASSLDNTLNAQEIWDYIVTKEGTYIYDVTSSISGSIYTGAKINVSGTSDINSINEKYFSSTAFPNPLKDKLTITHSEADAIDIYNILGKNIRTFNLKASETKTEIDLSEIPAGVYFYRISQEGIIVDTKKIVKQ